MKLRAAILGYGRSGGSMHAGAYEANSEDFDVAAVCDVDESRLELAKERFGCRTYVAYHEMLAKEELDVVSVVTRSDQHCRMTCDCLEAGANVLVTKPWAVDAVEALEMVQTAERTGRQLLPWLPSRWGCVFTRLKELVEGGAVGDVFLVRRIVCGFGTRNDWQTERRCGGGYLLNWGPHIVDPAVLLKGGPVRSVYGRMKQTINPGDTEDVFMALLNLEDGTLAQAEYTIACEDLPDWFVQGTRGTISAKKKSITVHRNTPAKPDDPTKFSTMRSTDEETAVEEVEGEIYGDQNVIYNEMAQALRGERPFAVTPQDALELSRILDAIRESDRENRVVSL